MSVPVSGFPVSGLPLPVSLQRHHRIHLAHHEPEHRSLPTL